MPSVINIMSAVAFALVVGVGVRAMYLDLYGYPTSKVETELCEGYRLRYDEAPNALFYDQLQCSGIKVGKKFPPEMVQYQVQPNRKHTLGNMTKLCRRPGTVPQDIGGKLGCMPYK